MGKQDYTLDNLLMLNGEIHEVGGGYWVKYEAKKTKASSEQKPFGIKYSITLHEPEGSRILGYDNAHGVPGAKPLLPHDHKHKGERIISYEYQSAAQLLEDFFKDVDKILKSKGVI